MQLEGKVALVTGAASGIGRAISLGYAREGARVVGVDRNRNGLEATVQQAAQGAVLPIVTDITDPEQVRQMVVRAVEAFGQLDILVNNAAVQLHGQDGRCHEVAETVWDATMAVNLRAPFLCAKYALPELIQTRGTLINIASPTAFQNLGAEYTAYATSKGGVVTLTRVLATDYARDGVRVNAIVPGATLTNLTAEVFRDPDFRDRFIARTPLGRLGQPEDLVGIAVFLASDASAYATGALFFVDGGITMA